jgi:hypothetical protein
VATGVLSAVRYVAMHERTAEGWYRDPTGRHEQRWFSDGAPTALVRDGELDARDQLNEHEAEQLKGAPLQFTHETRSAGLADPYAVPGEGPVAWWDSSVPKADEPAFDWGLDGARGYEITRSARFANRMGVGPALIVLGVAMVFVALLALGFGAAATAWMLACVVGAAGVRLVRWTDESATHARALHLPADQWAAWRRAIQIVTAIVIVVIAVIVVAAYIRSS